MIAGTEYAPGKAFIDAARAMLAAMAAGDFGKALEGLDANDDGKRWSVEMLRSQCKRSVGGTISNPSAMTDSARPRLNCIEGEDVYELRHAIPIGGRWSECCLVLKFVRKPRTGYFHVQLVGIE